MGGRQIIGRETRRKRDKEESGWGDLQHGILNSFDRYRKNDENWVNN